MALLASGMCFSRSFSFSLCCSANSRRASFLLSCAPHELSALRTASLIAMLSPMNSCRGVGERTRGHASVYEKIHEREITGMAFSAWGLPELKRRLGKHLVGTREGNVRGNDRNEDTQLRGLVIDLREENAGKPGGGTRNL